MRVSGRFPAPDASPASMEIVSMESMESMETKNPRNHHKINHFSPPRPAGDPSARNWRGEGYIAMPKSERHLIQIRITESQRARIKSLAARQHITIEKAVIEAFDAWAEKLRAPRPDRSPTQSIFPNPPAPPISEPSAAWEWEWLKQAIHLDWTQCPAVELLEDGVHQVWLLRETDAPLFQVLRAVADGIPLSKIAEVFDLEPPQLEKVIEFAR